MNSERENFEALRKLLSLKKYEQPPPRFFSDLPGCIWKRIEREPGRDSFYTRFFSQFSFQPALGYGVCLLACCALLFGVISSLKTESNPAFHPSLAGEKWSLTSKVAVAHSPGLPNFSAQAGSTNPVTTSLGLPSIFDQIHVQTLPAEFTVPPLRRQPEQ